MNRAGLKLQSLPCGSSLCDSERNPCTRWIFWPLLAIMALCAGCGRSESALTKIARDREANPIIKALAAYQKAKGDFPPVASVASDLAPYAPAGVKLNLWSSSADDYKAWKYTRNVSPGQPDGPPGQYWFSIKVSKDVDLIYQFEKGSGAWALLDYGWDVLTRPNISLPP